MRRTPVSLLLLDAIDGGLDTNDSTFVLDQFSDLHYQANNVNPEGYKSRTISTSLYEPADLQDIVNKCNYLLPHQQQQLYQMLQKFQKLFSGQLKTFKGSPVHLQLIENPTPICRRPYAVPTSHLTVFKAELQRFLQIGVIEKAVRSEWIAGTFIVTKKMDGFAGLQILGDETKACGAKFTPCARSVKFFNAIPATSFSQNWIYLCNTIPFFSMKLLVISAPFATPFMLYRYCRLPMVVSESPDIATENMHLVLDGIEDIEF